MMKRLVLAALAVALAPAAWAQPMPSFPPLKRLAIQPEPNAIPLYQGTAPGSEGAAQQEVWTGMGDEIWIRNITRPTLTPYLPKKGKANGAAVLVVPGGGFKFVSINNEGWPIAQWLANRGIAAFVLKYRVEATPESEADFMASFMAQIGRPRNVAVETEQFRPAMTNALADAQTALRMIRANAAKWGVDPARLGMLGFSAGAMTTMATALADAPDARPDFIAPIYGFNGPVTPPAKPQPLFAAISSDDPLLGNSGFGLIEEWKKAGGSVEMHYYSGGGHGFGAHKKGTTSDMWFDQFVGWMGARGLLKPVK